MAVTAKVKCTAKNKINEDSVSLSFFANYADDQGNQINKEWAVATPHLNISMTVNAEAAKHFELRKDYTLTFVEEE